MHEGVIVDEKYRRRLISYAVESDERAHANLGITLSPDGKAPEIVALHGTFAQGKQRVAGLVDNTDKAYLDQLCRRGYVHGKGHSVAHESRELMYGRMDAHLKPPATTKTSRVTDRQNSTLFWRHLRSTPDAVGQKTPRQ